MLRKFNRTTLSKTSFIIAFLISVFVFSNIFLSALLFVFGIGITYLQPLLSVLLMLASAFFFLRRQGWKRYALVLGVVFSLILSSFALSSITTDDTVDGPAYHEPAVGAMAYGWNPVYESIGSFHDSGRSPVSLPGGSYEKWVNHYPKAHWIYGANIYHLTGNIETGRSMAILVMYILFFIAFSYFSVRFKSSSAFLLASITALNPISTAQIFSYYNDGMMGNLLFVLILLFTMTVDKRYTYYKLARYILLGFVIALIINIKFTGLLYAGVYSLAYFIYIVALRNRRSEWWKICVVGASGLIVGIFIIGLSVYPKNYLEQGSPLYPLIGAKNTSDIITENQPASFEGMNNLKKLFISNFSETSNISALSGSEPQLKPPFSFTLEELPYLAYVDPRIGGYGVWFSGILIISIAILSYYAIKLVLKKRWSYFWLIALPLIPTAFLLLVMSDAWWARYFPQMYLIPVIALAIVIYEKKVFITALLLFAVLFNAVQSLSVQIPTHISNVEYRNSELAVVDSFVDNGQIIPKVYLNGYGGYAYRFYDRYGSIEILDKSARSSFEQSIKLAKDVEFYK